MRSDRLALVAMLVLPAIQACVKKDLTPFWTANTDYDLQLVVLDRPSRIAGGQPDLSPVNDTLSVRLHADSVVRDTVFGRLGGNAQHFPLMFRAVGGDRFVGTRNREEWKIVFNPGAIETSVGLIGKLSHGIVTGGWSGIGQETAGGNFSLKPAA
jgi:hypothetical protein